MFVSYGSFVIVKLNLLRAAAITLDGQERINEKVGRQMVVGAHSPSFGFEKHEDECEELVRIVNESSANVLQILAFCLQLLTENKEHI